MTMNPNRIAATIVWIVSVWFTALFLHGATELGYLLSSAFALALQGVLTIGERPLWRAVFLRGKGKYSFIGFIITLIDGALNAAGIYPGISKMNNSSVGLMLIDVFNLSPRIERVPAFIIALVIGMLVAGAAEYLWELE